MPPRAVLLVLMAKIYDKAYFGEFSLVIETDGSLSYYHGQSTNNYFSLPPSLFNGVTEAEAGRKPAPNEWNLKELVAHFIACERDLQSWAAQMLNDRLQVIVHGHAISFRWRGVEHLSNLPPRRDPR